MKSKVHAVHGPSPFKVVFGFDPALPFDRAVNKPSNNHAAEEVIHACQKLHKDIYAAQQKYNMQMTNYANKHRRPLEFEEVDNVYVLSENFRLPKTFSRKLAAKWLGPYRIITKVSPIAYHLQLPPKYA